MSKIDPKNLPDFERTVPQWVEKDNGISREYEFKDFNEAVRFVLKVAELAERFNHHPDIDLRFNKVILRYTTHGEGGLTEKDFAMASRTEELFDSVFL